MEKIKKIVWLCSFSDEKLRKNLVRPRWYWGNIVRKIMGMAKDSDTAIWDTNAIAEFEKIVGTVPFELHVIDVHKGFGGVQEFEDNGIHYHVVWSEYDIIAEKIKRKFDKRNINSFSHFRENIVSIIESIKPDIVHVIGIENKFHSMAVLDLPEDMIVISQLQTLVNDIRFKEGSHSTDSEYKYDSDIESRILLRSNYIGTTVSRFRELISANIKPDAIFVDTTLPLTEPLCTEKVQKKYDFVYFAANISKAVDWAIEAFIIAAKQYPSLTLDIIGAYDEPLKRQIELRLQEYNLLSNVTFEGRLPSHDDVLRQIRFSRFALLPLKIDIISGTIREAMANGLPVVTTITPGTPKLNNEIETVLLSAPGDHDAMADNMCRLLGDSDLVDMLRTNAYTITSKRKNNNDIIREWLETYNNILDK